MRQLTKCAKNNRCGCKSEENYRILLETKIIYKKILRSAEKTGKKNNFILLNYDIWLYNHMLKKGPFFFFTCEKQEIQNIIFRKNQDLCNIF